MSVIDATRSFCTLKLTEVQRADVVIDSIPRPVDGVSTLTDGKPAALVSSNVNASVARINTPSTKDLAKQIIRILNDEDTVEGGIQHRAGIAEAFEKVYLNSNFSDEVIYLIGQFINTPGIDSAIKTLSEEKGDNISGTSGELYHASELQKKGYRIVSLGFTLDLPGKRGIETDLIAEKDGHYYLAEVKHFPGRRLFGKGVTDSYVEPNKWAEKHILDIDNGTSRKLDNYSTLQTLLISDEPLQSFKDQAGPEANNVREYFRNNNLRILFSNANTIAVPLTLDGKSTISKDGTITSLGTFNDLIDTAGQNVAELKQVEDTVSEQTTQRRLEPSFERVNFRLFNKTSRLVDGDKITVERELVPILEKVQPAQVPFTEGHITQIKGLLGTSFPAELLPKVEATLKNLIGQGLSKEDLLNAIKPLGKDLRQHTQTLKKAVEAL